LGVVAGVQPLNAPMKAKSRKAGRDENKSMFMILSIKKRLVVLVYRQPFVEPTARVEL
jgi:hypothetical protein